MGTTKIRPPFVMSALGSSTILLRNLTYSKVTNRLTARDRAMCHKDLQIMEVNNRPKAARAKNLPLPLDFPFRGVFRILVVRIKLC